jgi:CheY-like chemotaxis protein
MVDDDPAILDIGKILLEQSKDIIVDTFKSPIEAMEKLKLESFDAIVSDYEMPGIDGITFLKRIRAYDNDIPFILLTGKGREEVVIEAINNGADSYLRKKGAPEVQFGKLAHHIQQNVAQKRAVEEIRKRDRLQAAVATAARELLTSTDLEDTVSHASKYLGLAASVDIVFIFENNDDSETGKHLMSYKFGWSREESLITEKRSFFQNMSYEKLCPSCHKHLSSGKTIRWTFGGFPETAREAFEKIPHLLSILIVPIIIEDHFWGFIGFGDCHSERIWSNSEVSVISTAAESIGGAIMRNRIEGELRKYQEDLEALVNERTAELEAKNSEM